MLAAAQQHSITTSKFDIPKCGFNLEFTVTEHPLAFPKTLENPCAQ